MQFSWLGCFCISRLRLLALRPFELGRRPVSSVDAKEALICGVLPQHRQDYVSHVVSAVRAHHGGIVLMHEIHPNAVRQLEKIILAILAEGYAFTSMEDPGFSSSIR
jgi:peptidoglycan/xylan/chitin deacetylase (PgdA/CDA1 family)